MKFKGIWLWNINKFPFSHRIFNHFINVLFQVMFEIFNHFLNVLYQITFLSQLPSIADGFVSALFFSLGKIKSALRIVVHLIENRNSIKTLFLKTLLLRSYIKFKTRVHGLYSMGDPWQPFCPKLLLIDLQVLVLWPRLLLPQPVCLPLYGLLPSSYITSSNVEITDEIVKFDRNCGSWLKLWNLVKIVKFGWNCEIWLKLWSHLH